MTTRFLLPCVGALIALVPGVALAEARPISLDEALRRAEGHPSIAVADADIDEARGHRTTAQTYVYNPELGVAAGPRFADQRGVDLEASLSQTFELGGKRAARVDLSTAGVRRAQALRSRSVQEVRWAIRAAYARALVARDRVAATTQSQEVADELAALARARLDAGNGDLLSVNQALAEVGRSARERLLAEQAYEEACYDLSAAVGVAAELKLEPQGSLEPRPDPAPNVDTAASRALEDRPDLVAVREETLEARANARLQARLATPDLTVGLTFAREEQAEIGLLSLSIPLPLWNRNQGGRAAASAAVTRSVIREDLAATEVGRQVRVAHDRWTKARAAVQAFDQQAIGTLRENLELTREAFESGKLSIVEFTLLRRSFVEVQLALLDALVAEIDAYYALGLVLGEDRSSR